MRQQILNSIITLKNKKTNEIIPILKKELIFESSKYSSTKENIWNVFINDIKLKKTSLYLISYKCLSCGEINSISTTQFLRKIRHCKNKCFGCSNIDNYNELKKTTLSIKTPVNKTHCKIEKKSYIEIHQDSLNEFEIYPDNFKNSYLLSHLTLEDYNRIKKNIISFSNGNKSEIDNYEFWSIYKVSNQMKFSSVIYDKVNNIIFKANQPIIKCDNCSVNWRCKSLEIFKNSYKLLCQSCKLCNRTFKIRPTRNINNEPIIYQSKLELKFINWCSENNIIVNNCPSIDYIWNDKFHKYKVNFKINDILIEIKDYHIWHNNQVKSGLWDIKLIAVNNYIKDNNLNKYFFITPKCWNQKCSELLGVIKNKN